MQYSSFSKSARIVKLMKMDPFNVMNYVDSSKKFLEQHAIPYITFSETITLKIKLKSL